ncbi:unnamed protein product [Adineta ricciae]|uniref:Uncharacterized protein n=1 Tax=Adineta ricciae TaxID=249248 RepID=A0A814BRH3_ADIRI|nr:unnamed protein product [Adineta ricciae]
MENNIKFIPTLTPTFEQWKALPSYLNHHETSLQRRFGAAKIIPPTRWIPLVKNSYEIRQIKLCIKQTIIRSSRQTNVFYIQNCETTKRRFMTYEECRNIAESDSYRLKDSINENFTDYFWSTITNNNSLYITNIDESLFAKREKIFNMSQLPSLLTYYPKSIPGVTTPLLHMGMWSTSVGLHIDDHDLISLNYLHHGAPKIWYIIHPSSYTKLEELVNELKLFSDISLSCLSPLQHKSLLLNPLFLQLHSIEYYQIEQKLNELVVIFPGTYHFYFDTGFNLSETVKYALPSWLQFQRQSPRLCSCSNTAANLINLNRRFFTHDILKQFQEDYLMSASSAYIDLSTDEDNSTTLHQTVKKSSIASTSPDISIAHETDFIQPTIHVDIPVDQYTELLYSSTTSSETPTSDDLLPTSGNSTEQNDIWNIFNQLSSQFNSDSIQHSHPAIHYHPYKSYPPAVSKHISSIYTSYLRTHSYPSLRSCHSSRRFKRRKCYGCRQHGHLRKECPHFPHE